MDDSQRDAQLDDLPTANVSRAISIAHARTSDGRQQIDAHLVVACADGHNIRVELADALRALAMDIEAGVA